MEFFLKPSELQSAGPDSRSNPTDRTGSVIRFLKLMPFSQAPHSRMHHAATEPGMGETSGAHSSTACLVGFAAFLLILQASPRPPIEYLVLEFSGDAVSQRWSDSPPDAWHLQQAARQAQLRAAGRWWWQAEAARHYQKLELTDAPATAPSTLQWASHRSSTATDTPPLASTWSKAYREAREQFSNAMAQKRSSMPRTKVVATRWAPPGRRWLLLATTFGILTGSAYYFGLTRQASLSLKQSAVRNSLPDEQIVEDDSSITVTVDVPGGWFAPTVAARLAKWSALLAGVVVAQTTVGLAFRCGTDGGAWRQVFTAPFSAIAALWG